MKPKRPKAKRVAVTLTVAQWQLVTEACSEWAEICSHDSDIGGAGGKILEKRSEAFQNVGTKIGVQVLISTKAIE